MRIRTWKVKDKLFETGFCVFQWAVWILWLWEAWVPLHFTCQKVKNTHFGKWTLARLWPTPGCGVGAGRSWHSNCHATVWRNRKPSSDLKGKKNVWDGESGLRKEGLCPLMVRQVFVAGGWARRKKKKGYRKTIWFSVCASDFSSQRKKWRVIWETCLCQYC